MTKLYKYQKEGVKQIINFNGRVLLADEMGLGKTIQALTFLHRQSKSLPALVVCPASVKWVWCDEIKKHTNLRPSIISGKTPRKGNPKDVTIINYDLLSSWKILLQKIGYNTLILDECHYVKAHKAQRTRAAISIGKKTPNIIAMSGTPLTSRPKELFQILKLLHPKEFPSYTPYAFRYCNRRITPWGWDDNGASHIDELHNKLKSLCLIRRTKKEVLKELPNKQRVIIPLSVDNKLYKEYLSIEKDFANWCQRLSSEQKERAIKSEGLSRLRIAKRMAAEIKMKSLLEWIDDFFDSTNQKLVVFAWHVSVIEKIYNHYKNKIHNSSNEKKVAYSVVKRLKGEPTNFCVKIHGGTHPRERNQIVGRFQNNESCRLLVGQLVAAGTGITLTAASNVLMAELDFTPANHIQAEDRCHRIGQKNSVTAYYTIAKGTVEEKLCKVLQSKFQVVTNVLDGVRKTTLAQRYSIYDLLIETYKKKGIQ